MPKAPPYVYQKLTWPEINDAVAAGKIPIVPVGSIEQHGPHLPLDVDCVCPQAVAYAAAQRVPDDVLVLPVIPLGYLGHVMDFPGTINVHYQHFIDIMIDIGKSLAYHGFKKMIFLNGHGSNMPNLDLACRRINLETDAECTLLAWWSLLTIDPAFMKTWREGDFPGSCAHACELETSMYLHLDHDNVRHDKCEDGRLRQNEDRSAFNWVDLFGAGPAGLVRWTSEYMGNGTGGAADLATAEKGKAALDEAGRQLAAYVAFFKKQAKPVRVDRHGERPTFPMPWGQGVTTPALHAPDPDDEKLTRPNR